MIEDARAARVTVLLGGSLELLYENNVIHWLFEMVKWYSCLMHKHIPWQIANNMRVNGGNVLWCDGSRMTAAVGALKNTD